MTEEEIKQYASKGSTTEFASLDKVLGEYVAAVDELEDVRRKRTELAASVPGAVDEYRKVRDENGKIIAECIAAHEETSAAFDEWRKAVSRKEYCQKVWQIYRHNLTQHNSSRTPTLPDCEKPEDVIVPEKPECVSENLERSAASARVVIAKASDSLFAVASEIKKLDERETELVRFVADRRAAFLKYHVEYFNAYTRAENEIRARIRQAEANRQNEIKSAKALIASAQKRLEQLGAN